jgi:shikimate kinase/shikimate 5-dehydrogenase
MKKSQNIKKYAILARPVAHSRSPELFAQIAPKNSFYSRIHIRNPGEIIYFLEELNLDGFNVSAPWKESASKIFGTFLSNVFVKSANNYNSFNTDVLAVKHILAQYNFDKNTKCLVIGAGGAAFSVISAFKMLGLDNISICNRTDEKAKNLADRFSCNQINFSDLNNNIKLSKLVISTLPSRSYNFNSQYFDKSQILLDANYNESDLEKISQEVGCEFISGTEWLKWQAKFGFEYFINKPIMLQNLSQIGGGRKGGRKGGKNILLIGFMGSGKSSVGKLLAEKLGREFIDLDKIIEQKACKSIKDIFAEDGEQYFRKLESEALDDICKSEGQIIASGGGIIENKNNSKIIRENCFCIYLYSDVETLWSRVKNSPRPLARNHKIFTDLYKSRQDKYFSASDLIILHNDARQTVQDLTYEINSANIFER